LLQVSSDDADPDYTPDGKQGSGRRRSNVLGKRIKLEVDNGLDHLSEDTDGAFAGDGSLDGSFASSFRNRSLVWQVFVKEPDSEYVKCTICGIHLKLMSGSTTTMLKHYISKHPEEYQEALTGRVQAVRTHLLLLQQLFFYIVVIYMSCHHTTYGDRSFAVSGPLAWNSLPVALRSSDVTEETFRRPLKTFLFNCLDN